ncbi:MAG: AI-2E family transporter [Bilifractor sp.]|jgi:predicted PurR-regulated permease PerM
MKWFKKWSGKSWSGYAAAACVAVLFYVILTHLDIIFGGIGAFFGFISPVIVGMVMAYIINPLVNLLRRTVFQKVRNETVAANLSIFCSVVLVLLLIVILVVSLVPQLITSIATFANNVDNYATSFRTWISSLNSISAGSHIDISKLTNLGTAIMDKITAEIPDLVNKIINTSFTIGTGFVTGCISFILAIYILVDKRRIKRNGGRALRYMFSEKHYPVVAGFLNRCNRILIRYIVCDLLDGLIVGTANFIFMNIAGMPYATLISVVVGVTNLAPTFGPILGGVIGAFILLLVNPWYSLWFLIFTLILQTCDGYVLKPKLFGETLGVSSLWILICIIVGGRMFGVIGILLAIPLAAIIDFIFREYLIPWMKRRKAARNAAVAEVKAEPGITDGQNTDSGK